MARPMKPLVRGGGFYPSRKWTPLVYAGGYTTANGGEEPAPPPIEKTVTGNPIHILDALAKPAQALSVKLEPIQDLNGYDNPWPAGGSVNKLPFAGNGTMTKNGITMISNGDGTYTVTGSTSSDSANVFFDLFTSYTLEDGDYLHIGNSVANASCTFNLDYNGGGRIEYYGASPVNRIAKIESTHVGESVGRIRLYFAANQANISMTFKPMICKSSTAIGFVPYSNICPISGWTGANIYVSPTTDEEDGTTYSITFPTSAGTVYGGTLDVTAGKLTVDKALVTFNGSETWYDYPSFQGFYTSLYGMKDGIRQDGISNMLIDSKSTESGQKNAMWLGVNSHYFFALGVYETMGNTLEDFKTFLSSNNLQVVYPLATPQTIQLTPTQVELLLGENNLFSDGEMTLTYLADGNASDEEALNILLGGRYVNNHGEDEPTDREALDILLGRTR